MYNLNIGEVWQTFANNTYSGPFILKSLPWEGYNSNDYWYNRVQLYNLDGSYSHHAHINSLMSDIPSDNPKMIVLKI